MSEENWLDALPEPLRDAPFLAKAESADDAVGKLVHAAKLVGSSVRIPEETASQEDKDAFFGRLAEIPGVALLPTHDDTDGLTALFGKLGRPEEHTGYKLPEIADFEWDETVGNDLRQYAHDAGLTDKQFDTMATRIAEQEIAANTASDQTLTDRQKELRTDWGDTLESREALIRGWMEKSDAPPSMRQRLDDRSLPLETMNWLNSIAQQFKGEVAPVKQDGTSENPPMTPTQALAEVPRVLQDMQNMSDSDPRYRGLQEKLLNLHRLANPDAAA